MLLVEKGVVAQRLNIQFMPRADHQMPMRGVPDSMGDVHVVAVHTNVAAGGGDLNCQSSLISLPSFWL